MYLDAHLHFHTKKKSLLVTSQNIQDEHPVHLSATVTHAVPLNTLLRNPDFDTESGYAAHRECGDTDKRKYKDFISGDWPWR